MELFGILVIFPWLALLPAVFFAYLYRRSKRPMATVAATCWALYSIYEFSMYQRWLCSGECNIRVDLILIYPVLIVLSIVALMRGLRSNTASLSSTANTAQ